MPFIETPRFPTTISQGSRGGPSFNTNVIEVRSGQEQRNSVWTYPRHKYDVAYGIKAQDTLEDLIDYFITMKGRWGGFRFKDHLDYKSVHTNQSVSDTDQLIGIGDNSETDFQLIKNYAQGAESVARKILKPVSGTVVISLDDVGQGSGWSVDTTTGIVTFSTAPGSGVDVKAGFEFDVPVRFDADEISISIDDYQMGAAQVPLIEVKDTT